MQETLTKLNLLGYNTDAYLVGLNQFISKEITIVKHQCLPESHASQFFEDEESTVLLPNGNILFTEKPAFWNHNFSSDMVLKNGETVREWSPSGYGNLLQEWVFEVKEHNISYNEYGQYCRHMTDETFTELVDAFYEKATLMVNNPNRLPQFVSMLINTDYADAELMAEIADSYTDEQVDNFIEAVKRCKDLKLPITDYREVFNFSQTA